MAPVISVYVKSTGVKEKINPLTGLLESQRIDNRTVSESSFLQKTSSSDRAAIKAQSLEKKSPSLCDLFLHRVLVPPHFSE